MSSEEGLPSARTMSGSRPKRIAVLFPHEVRPLVKAIDDGDAPRERLYGFYELMDSPGLEIQFADSRFRGWFGRFVLKMKSYGLNPIDFGTMVELARADVIVVKDNVSLTASVLSAALRTPVVYYDCLFEPPRSRLKQLYMKACLRLAARIVGYSENQRNIYCNLFALNPDRFELMSFALDPRFYHPRPLQAPSGEPFVLSVGRDMGRDFRTLREACRRAGIRLKLVTLPYLLDGEATQNEEILQRLSYPALFELYQRASAVVVPLKPGITYPSGVRAVLEALVLNRPTIVSATEYVQEAFTENEALRFCPPADVQGLTDSLLTLLADLQDGPPSSHAFAANVPDYAGVHEHLLKVLDELP